MHLRHPVLWLPLVAASSTLLPASSGDDELWSQAELESVSEEIKEQIAQLRGQAFKHGVRVEIQDKDGLIAYMKKRQDEFEPEADRKATERLAKLFGMVPQDLDLDATLQSVIEQQVGGFYDPADDAFFLMESFTGDLARLILAHELVHALDDQWYDLDGTIESLLGSTDALEAYRSVIEGSATYAMQAWMMKHAMGLDREALMESNDMLSGGLDDAPAFLWKPLISAYMQGMLFLADGDKRDVDSFIELAFKAPPRSMEQVLHPEKYWDEGKRDEPRTVQVEFEEPGDWKVVHEDTYGELYLALMTAPADQRGGLDASNPMAFLTLKYTNDAASGWDGDRVVLLENGDTHAAMLVTVWDSPEDSTEFATALKGVFSELEDDVQRSVEVAFGDVVVVKVVAGEGELPQSIHKIAGE